MLLTAVATRSASAPIPPGTGWLKAVRAGISHLKRLLPRRQSPNRLDTLGAAALEDIGLSPSDLPSVKSGQFFRDPTRKQR